MPKFIVYTDDELVAMISRQPLPLTVMRFLRIMNGRIGKNAAYSRIKKLADQGLLLSKKFRYSHSSGNLTVFGTGSQMEKLDEIWKKEKGREGLARYESDWYM